MNAPTLLIGLGGTGCKIIERVSKQVRPEQRANIAFAVFDTDINDLRGIQERNPYIYTIQTSTKQTVGDYLNQDTHARDTWFPVNAIQNGKTLTEGAGQVRSISRLALETVIRAGKMEPLHEAIQSLYKVETDKADQALRVVICSSLAGGTGSGLILPVAMYVKNYLTTHFRQSANITRGFFILPEVFDEVIVGQAERNTLKANAYATLRELDAFLMKGDNTLHERYKDSVVLQFPRVAVSGYEEYAVRPYDFCFLFDAQNADGGKLNSFDDYLEHAANCIYAQSMSPMNKRSNSSEDNTIRKLAKERGRNRYAGAGASMLIYPFEDIRTFIALKWAKQSVSAQWLTFDNMYRDICLENSKKLDQGFFTQNPESAEFYVNQIDALAKQDEPFAKAIVNSCIRVEADGITKSSDRWMDYVNAILAKVERDLEASSEEMSSAHDQVVAQIGNLEKDWDEFVTAYHDMERYQKRYEMYVQGIEQSLAFAMFNPPKDRNINQNQDYKLETYLVSGDNKFLHPNAIRYLLIKILQEMKKIERGLDYDIKEGKEYFDTFEKSTFDDPETEDVESVDDLTDRKSSKVPFKKNNSLDQEEIKRKYRQYLSKVDEYMVQEAQHYVFQKGIEYIDSLIRAFESFFTTLESKVDSIDSNINEIYKKYDASKGNTAVYVAASRKCLDKMYEKKPYKGSAVSIDSELAQEIYYKVNEYANMREKPGNNRYFGSLFDDGILGYFEKSVMREYGMEIDIDIISAMEMEAIYESNPDISDDTDTLTYVKKKINDVRELSCPFIESPLGEAREPIHACTFHKSLEPEKGDDSPRTSLIKKELMNNGGSPDEDVPKNMIMFYQSFYGLRANDLGKFAPSVQSETYNRPTGDYFRAYYDLVKGIHPSTHLSKEITPHIDRWWHLVTKMPDLDEENQAKQENAIYAAFFWGLIEGYIKLYEENSHKIYKLEVDTLKMEDGKLLVSNGTECDKFYEVLDAIAIYPELVEKINSRISMLKDNELNDGKALEEGILLKGISNLSVKEPGLGLKENTVPATSIFSIPVLMKKSTTKDEYYEEYVIQILKVAIGEIKDYLGVFCSEKELPEVMGKLLKEQFARYLTDIEEESKSDKTIFKESLFDRTCAIVASALEDLKLMEDANDVRDKRDAYRK